MFVNYIGLGLYLKKQRKLRKLSLVDIACNVGVSVSYLSRLENASKNYKLDIDKVYEISNLMRLDIDLIDSFLGINRNNNVVSLFEENLSKSDVPTKIVKGEVVCD